MSQVNMNLSRTHLISVLAWLLSVATYLYIQNNLYSISLVLLLLFILSRLGLKMNWIGLIKAWALLSTGFVLFYGLFLHTGDRVLFSIPGNMPFISGNISLNSLLYGFFLGGSFTLALYIFSLSAEFMKQRRLVFYLPGIWKNFSMFFSFLSYFTSFLFRHHKTFQEKLHNRDLKLSTMQQFRLFLHDSSFHAVESSFSFAESLETRGFSRSQELPTIMHYQSILTLLLLLFAFIFYRITHHPIFLVAIIMISIGVFYLFKKLKLSSFVSQQYNYSPSIVDGLIVGWSFIFMFANLWNNQTNYISQNTFKDYFRFDSIIHLLFVIHGLVMCWMYARSDRV